MNLSVPRLVIKGGDLRVDNARAACENGSMTSEADLESRMQNLARVIAALDAAINWSQLGDLYCSEGGEDFFCEEQRDATVEAGMEFARELGMRLGSGDARGKGASLYVGAAVFELLPALFECLVLSRNVTLINLDQEETVELNRALDVVAKETDNDLPHIGTYSLRKLEPALFDHIWMTSVLTDPGAFPALHDYCYEREGSELGTNMGDLEVERAAAACLVADTLTLAAPAFWLTTTDEELPFFAEECEARALTMTVPETGRLSGIVGDPVRHCYVSSEAESESA